MESKPDLKSGPEISRLLAQLDMQATQIQAITERLNDIRELLEELLERMQESRRYEDY